MSRLKKVIRNIIILAVLFLIPIRLYGLYISPVSAHEHSERDMHYGPSEVIQTINIDNEKYLLCKYDKWVSCNIVKRKLHLFWEYENTIIVENNRMKAVNYSWSGSYQDRRLFGIINDDSIIKIEISNNKGKILTQTVFYDDLFLLTWKLNKNGEGNYKNIKGYDADNKILFEEEFMG